jgi:hypothetical protein
MMIDAVITQLSSYLAGISKPVTVVEFGASSMPSAPYVVVKQEKGPDGMTDFRIIGHMLPGQQSALRLMMRKDVQNALHSKTLTDSTTKNTILVRPNDLPGQIVPSNSDGTISQERLFYMADILI